MNIFDIANKINCRSYRSEITPEIRQMLIDANSVAIFGCSDDLIEFDGKFRDEISAWGGRDFQLNKDGLPVSKCSEGDDCFYFKQHIMRLCNFTVEWYDSGCSWFIYTNDIDYATFDICDDGEIYCQGIVVNLDDVARFNSERYNNV